MKHFNLTTTTLALATVAALSLGVGAAMAQEGPTVSAPSDWAATPRFQVDTVAANDRQKVSDPRKAMPEAGSSDTYHTTSAELINGVGLGFGD